MDLAIGSYDYSCLLSKETWLAVMNAQLPNIHMFNSLQSSYYSLAYKLNVNIRFSL